jgi:hypothetical protein
MTGTPPAPAPSMLDHFLRIAEVIGAVFLALSLLGALILFLTSLTSSYKLLRRTFDDAPLGEFLATLRTLVAAACYRASRKLRSRDVASFYDCIRMRVEHEIFRHRRGLSTKDPFGDRTIGDVDTKGEDRRRLTAGDVNDAFHRIRKYFATLEHLETDRKELKFLCTLTIETGFVSPIHLLAGLLSRFDEAWPKIVRAYNQDVSDDEQAEWMASIRGEHQEMPEWIIGFRKIQKFNFDCWLQWGPSIPNSDSDGDQKMTSIQYGFGDENNSIELVGDRETLQKEMKELWKVWRGTQWRPLAMPARVQGRVTHSAVLAEVEKKDVSDALLKSWGDEGRILLMPSSGTGQMISKTKNEGFYYSAYIWVMFVVTIKHQTNRPFQPLHCVDAKPDLTTHPWLDLFPFFEHCNIACPAALFLIKRQLALKAVTGIQRLVDAANGPKGFPLRFKFTCAIDEPGAKEAMWLDQLKERDKRDMTLLELMQELSPRYPDLFSKPDPIIDLDCFVKLPEGPWPYSTHRLVDHVNNVSERIDRA